MYSPTTTTRVALLIGALSLITTSACFLPLSTAAPQSATTLGQGHVGVSAHGEMPTVDLLATEAEDADDDFAETSPFPTASVQLGFGLTDTLDIEVTLEGTLYWFVVPLPLGASVAARYQVLYNDVLAISATGRAGFVRVEGLDVDTDSTRALSATYGGLTAAAQLFPDRVFRPTLAVNLSPASINNQLVDQNTGEVQRAERYSAASISATLAATFGAGPVEIGPFINLVAFRSPYTSTRFMSGGVMFAIRPRKKKLPATTTEPAWTPVNTAPTTAPDTAPTTAPGAAPGAEPTNISPGG